jgi:putative transposase
VGLYADPRGANLHHRVARGTSANILRRHGLERAPERQRRDDVAGVLAGAPGRPGGGFLYRRSPTATGLTRFPVFFLLHMATRRVEIAGIVAERDSAWVTSPTTLTIA